MNKGVLRYPITTEPTSLDPATVQDGDSISIVGQEFEGLVQWNQQNKIQGCSANRWEVSADGCTYTFHLRPGLRFSNGRAVTAQDFKSCWERNCRPTFSSQTARRFLNDITGAREMLSGRASHIAGVQARDGSTLVVKLDRPRAYFLEKLTVPVAAVYATEALADPGKLMRKPAEMVGSGAFKMVYANVDQEIDLVANRLYWDGAPSLSRIERPYVPDSSARLSMFKSGYANYLRLEREDVKTIESDPVLRSQLHFCPRPALWYFGVNCKLTPAFSDVRVRRALAMAIDRNWISKVVLEGINPSAGCILPPGIFGHRDDAPCLPYDPAQARRLFAQAGHPDGRGLPEITIWFRNNRPDMKLLAVAVGQELTKNLNLKASLKATEWAWLLASANKRQVPFMAMRWSADYLDPQDFLSGLLCTDAAGNSLQYSNRAFDELCEKADALSDPGERASLYARAENLALRDAVMIPICFEQDSELVSPHVHGIRTTLVGHMPHSRVTVE